MNPPSLQVVKELRTDYSTAVTSCASYMMDALRSQRSTDLKSALSQPLAGEGGQGTLQNIQEQVGIGMTWI